MKCNILIVDDSPILRRAIRKAVRLAGVDPERIFEAGDGIEALAALDEQWVDLVLLDLNMPVMDGEAFLIAKNKRDDIRDIAVVIVSTESNRARLDKLNALGVSGSLRKPFEPEDLLRVVRRVLGVAA